jgi:hypothetical protein
LGVVAVDHVTRVVTYLGHEVGLHDDAVVGHRRRHQRHLQRRRRRLELADRRQSQEGLRPFGVREGRGGGGRQVERRPAVEAEGVGSPEHVVLADDLGAHAGEGRVARHAQDVEQGAAARAAAEVADGVAVRRFVRRLHREVGLVDGHLAGFDADRPGEHLEGRAREEALLVAAAPQRTGRIGVERLQVEVGDALALLVASGRRQQVGVERRRAPQGEHRAVAGIDGHHRARTTAGGGLEGGSGDLLDVLADGEADVARAVAVDEQVGQRSVLLLAGLAGQLAVVGLLDAGGAEVEVEVAGHMAEQVTFGIEALVLEPPGPHRGSGAVERGTGERILAGGVDGLDRAGEHGTVGRHDLAPGPVEVADDGPGVAWVAVEVAGMEDLDVVHHGEQRHVAGEQARPEPAELAVHGCTATAGIEGRLLRAVSSDTRTSSASNT